MLKIAVTKQRSNSFILKPRDIVFNYQRFEKHPSIGSQPIHSELTWPSKIALLGSDNGSRHGH
jgi:hypothetical protein